MNLIQITNSEHTEIATTLWVKIFPDEPLWVKKYVINDLYRPRIRNARPAQPYFIAYHRNKPVGLCGLYKHKGEYWLGWFGVLPEARGDGLGSKMLQALIQELKIRQPRVTELKLWTEGGRDIQNFYRNHGFKYAGKLVDNLTDARIYRKDI